MHRCGTTRHATVQGNQIVQSNGSVWAGRGANIPDSYLCGRCQGTPSDPTVRFCRRL